MSGPPRTAAANESLLPAVSVVVASFRDLALLTTCLESLRAQCAAAGAELVLARADGGEPDAMLERIAAGCKLVRVPAGSSVPAIRGAGLAQARGEWVAITEDHCVADPDWLSTLLAARGPGVQVLGGGMGNAQRRRAVDWGAFFAEYGFYGAVRRAPGTAPLITEANAAYHRSVLAEVTRLTLEGSWENVVHDRLFAAGSTFRLVPEARIRQNLNYGLRAFCRDRFEHGRAYAESRCRGVSFGRRLVFLAGAPALPMLLTLRIFRSASREELRYFGRGLPAMLAFLCAWATGEAFGYAMGPAR